jgi:hypothetical protein
MNKKEQKKAKKEKKNAQRLVALYEKAVESENLSEAFSIVMSEPYIDVVGKYEVIFLLGRAYERREMEQQTIKEFESQKNNE